MTLTAFVVPTANGQEVKEKQQVIISGVSLISASVGMVSNNHYFDEGYKPKGLSGTFSYEKGVLDSSLGCISFGSFGEIGQIEEKSSGENAFTKRTQYVVGGFLGYHYCVFSNCEIFARAKIGLDFGSLSSSDVKYFNNRLLPKELEVGTIYMFSNALGMSLSAGYSSHLLSAGIVYRIL